MTPGTPIWFDEEYYAEQKIEQMNVTAYAGRTDWDAAAYEHELARYNVTPYENFLATNAASDISVTNISPNRLFNVQEYLLALARFANDSGYSYGDFKAGEWTAQKALQHMLKDYGVSAWDHYARAGQYDLLNPSNAFDTGAYYSSLTNALNTYVDPATGRVGWEGRSDWTAKELAALNASIGLSPIVEMTESPLAAGIPPVQVAQELQVLAQAAWNPWQSEAGVTQPSMPGGSESAAPGQMEMPTSPGNTQPRPGVPAGEDTSSSGDAVLGGNHSNTTEQPDHPGETSGTAQPSVEPGAPDNPPIDPGRPTETIELTSNRTSYTGASGVDSLFVGEVNCEVGSFNSRTVVTGGEDSENTLRLTLTSLDREQKGGSTTNIQNVEMFNKADGAQRNFDASKLANVRSWTINGSPIAIVNIDNPECVINIRNLHNGGDAYDLMDSVAQTADQFATINLGSAEGLEEGAACHSTSIKNLNVVAGQDSGNSIFLNFDGLRHLRTNAPGDFAFELNCNPETIEGSGTFKLLNMNVTGVSIDGGETQCNVELPNGFGRHSFYGAELQNVESVCFDGVDLRILANNGLRALDYTPSAKAGGASSVYLQSKDGGDFDLVQHISSANTSITINGIANLAWEITGSGDSGPTTLTTGAAEIAIDARQATGHVYISSLQATGSVVTFNAGTGGAKLENVKAAKVSLTGECGDDVFSVAFSDQADLAGNGGNDMFTLKSMAGGTQPIATGMLSAADGSAETFSMDISGTKKMLVRIEDFENGSDTLKIDNGTLANAEASMLAQFGIGLEGVDLGNYLYNAVAETAWAFAQNSKGAIMACIELAGISANEAAQILGDA